MLPLVESALASLKSLSPNVPSRQRAPLELPPVEVQVLTGAMHLGLGDLNSHASSTATDSRLNALTKAINACRAGVVGSVDAGYQDDGEEFGIEEPVIPAPVEETGIVVVRPAPVASGQEGTVEGEAMGLVNGEAEGEVAAMVALGGGSARTAGGVVSIGSWIMGRGAGGGVGALFRLDGRWVCAEGRPGKRGVPEDDCVSALRPDLPRLGLRAQPRRQSIYFPSSWWSAYAAGASLRVGQQMLRENEMTE